MGLLVFSDAMAAAVSRQNALNCQVSELPLNKVRNFVRVSEFRGFVCPHSSAQKSGAG